VLGLALDGVDAGDVELGVAALVPDLLRRVMRDDAELSHGGGGVRLDLEPDTEPRFGVPDRSHLGTAVARNHWAASRKGSGGLADAGHVLQLLSRTMLRTPILGRFIRAKWKRRKSPHRRVFAATHNRHSTSK